MAPWLKVTVFVENIVGRQERLESFLDRRTRLEERCGIVEWLPLSLVPLDVTDQQRRFAEPRLEFLEDLQILRDEARFEDEVLRRITSDRQFRHQYQFRAVIRQPLIGGDDFLKVSAQGAHGRID